MPTVRILARSGYSRPHLDAPARPAVIDGRNQADLAEVSAADRLTTGDAARRDVVGQLVTSLELVRSGVAQPPQWRPEAGTAPAGPLPMWCGVARKAG